ncbi:malto-oligosyltrehalose trehalohydrolase [Nocardiopsis terrae]|uniref:Malto-oligosyltrehalose trehalohydrolase n=1 Tax=Nocardiopsis terrae TaxID=372655 RepID=A0ABR9HHS2_9ACTN|nr:malto-oligosyltrehalose trehalohydrolase [Nocardiopsis terrae]MBE1458577.1 maltooligosyltrehalose trehalohydrolase [Nocardiopsis terrae]GHC79654.1 malto-oligosyltrehalose trehalohydrolase [Nocardiopsis terrae]
MNELATEPTPPVTPGLGVHGDFSVWAPGAQRVRVRVDGTAHSMRSDARGWWYAQVEGAGPGSDYAYLLDEDPQPLPDPRSLWQPDGVHAPSRVYDHGSHVWADDDWTGRPLAGAVIYELHVGTFTPQGTLTAAADRLGHLVDLGVTHVELMPLNAFDGTHGWGYDGVLWSAVHQPYGGPDALKGFVEACHRRGLAVLLDVVYNHLGPSGAYLPRFGPYFSGENDWGPSLNLDGPGSDSVRQLVIDGALDWLRHYRLDGLRLDAVHALRDDRAVPILAELSAEVDALAAGLGRPLSLVAESDRNDPRTVLPLEADGLGMTAQWSDDLHHALHVALTGERHGYYADFDGPRVLAETLRRVFWHDGTPSAFRGRRHGARVDTSRVPASRFLGYLSNHDQVGNRARGDRMGEHLSPGLLTCGAAIVLCSPYTPMIFMGEEWGATTPWPFFASFTDPGLVEGVRRGRRREFAALGWAPEDIPDPMDPATRDGAVLDWSEPEHEPRRLVLDTYRALIALRRSEPELCDPRLDRFAVTASEDGRRLVLHRGSLRLVCNLGAAPARVELDAVPRELLLANGHPGVHGVTVDVPGEFFAVLRV